MGRLLDAFQRLVGLRARKRVHAHRYQSEAMATRVALVRARRREMRKRAKR